MLNIVEFRAMALVRSSAGDELLDDGLAGGRVEGVGHAESEGEDDDVPGPDRRGRSVRPAVMKARAIMADLGDDHQPAARHPVGDDAGRRA